MAAARRALQRRQNRLDPRRLLFIDETAGAILFYLPAYSPDLNPIEQLFAKLKSMLRKIAAYSLKQAAYTADSLCAAIALSLTKISRSECAAYLTNSGYSQSYREAL